MRGFPKIWRASHFPNSARYSGKLYKRKKNNKKMQKSLVIFPERAIISFAKYRKNIMFLQGALAQLGARNIRIVEARGSNPLCSRKTRSFEFSGITSEKLGASCFILWKNDIGAGIRCGFLN